MGTIFEASYEELQDLRAENERLRAIIKAAEIAIARDEDMNGAMRWLLSAAEQTSEGK